MRVLGIDPGLGGAFALYDTSLDFLIVHDMPTLPAAKGKRSISPVGCAEIVATTQPDVIFVERVSAMPKQGVTSSFNFGLGYGVILGVIGAVKVPYHLVSPREWKQRYRLGSDKKLSRAAASRLYPQHAGSFNRAKDDGRAEAALLAHFGASHNTV